MNKAYVNPFSEAAVGKAVSMFLDAVHQIGSQVDLSEGSGMTLSERSDFHLDGVACIMRGCSN